VIKCRSGDVSALLCALINHGVVLHGDGQHSTNTTSRPTRAMHALHTAAEFWTISLCRWRFGRRWRAEQAKQLDPTYGQEPDDEDTWDAALGCADASTPDRDPWQA